MFGSDALVFLILQILLILSDIFILSHNTIFAFYGYARWSEVDQQADVFLGAIEIIDGLNFVLLIETSYRFQLDNDTVFHKQIDKKVTDDLVVIVDFQRLLGFSLQVLLGKLNDHCLFINTFQEAEPELVVYVICASDDLVGQLLMFHFLVFRQDLQDKYQTGLTG